MWRELVAELYPAATFSDGATEDRLRSAERELGHPMPDQLVAVLRESDGVYDGYGGGLIWCLDRIVADNRWFRTNAEYAELYMPFDLVLFFADAGNGDQFGLILPPVDRDDVFVWNHVDDSRTWGAANVETYLRWWASGQLTT
ncbi:SMI1/KNR4 family protein [Kineosporia sp. R_H_3]|uniref:SMI1/KNR4 family protein n=1 Tax=Kineosporia sp. R_H_3 TaxID=1961848 RepID=UPI000B4BAA39|nr:SMI1/KNR4 family protein [Kineosporia sp. R_H_3]